MSSSPSPQTFGSYNLVRALAEGGMARIYLAKHVRPGGFEKTVVVKQVLSELSSRDEFVKMFMDEARISARLSHPNIVAVFDFGEISGSYYMTMEYLAGEDLRSLLAAAKKKGEHVPLPVVLQIALEVCDGLEYAHSLGDENGRPMGIVHRDISPSNVMVTFQGAVKVLDFGIASSHVKLVETQTGVLKGKYQYMSPEQISAKPLDKRSDLFAVGAVLYEMLTGVRIFQRQNELQVMRAILEEPILAPSAYRAGLHAEVDQVVLRALERDPEARFQSAGEMRNALSALLGKETYVPSAERLQGYVTSLFGTDHIRVKQRPLPTQPHLPMHPTLAPVEVGSIDVDLATASGPTTPVGPPIARPGTGSRRGMDPMTTPIGHPPAAMLAAMAGHGPIPTPAAGIPAPPVPTDPSAPAISATQVAQGGPPTPSIRARLGAMLLGVAIAGVLVGIGVVVSRLPGTPPPPAVAVVAPTPAPPPKPPDVAPVPPVPPANPQVAAEIVDDGPEVAPKPVPPATPRAPKAPPKVNPKKPPQILAVVQPPGSLKVNCIPWCRIYVDGQDTGKNSPAQGISLPAGKHVLKVVNPPTAQERERTIEVGPGRETVETIRF